MINVKSYPSQKRSLLKTSPQFIQPNLNIDSIYGIIKNVSVCSVGEAAGHDVYLDQSFINDVVRLGNAYEIGLKCRFGHPSLSNEALGTYLGRFKDFRVQDDKAIADLHLDEVAKKSPGGDLYTWVMAMSKKNADQFGASCVFEPGDYYQIVNGEKTYDADNRDLPVYASIKQLFGVDLVDEPAANESGLFAKMFNADKFGVRVASFLDDNPDIWQFIDQHPEKFKPFLIRYNAYKNKTDKVMQSKHKSFFTMLADAFMTSGKPSASRKIAFAQVDAVTDDGQNIRVDAVGDAPAVGDAVYIVDSETDEQTVAPDGDYTISGGDFDGYKLTVVAGLITAVFNPNDQTIEVQQNAIPSYKSLQAENLKIKDQLQEVNKQLKQLQDSFELFKKTPLDQHTKVIPDGDGIGITGDPYEIFAAKSWNKKARKKV